MELEQEKMRSKAMQLIKAGCNTLIEETDIIKGNCLYTMLQGQVTMGLHLEIFSAHDVLKISNYIDKLWRCKNK